MEVVLLATITLNRIGSAGAGGGFSRHREAKFFSEVPNAELSVLRALVIEMAESNGEARGVLKGLTYESGYSGVQIFNIQGPGTLYSTAYAECEITYALKADGRYFKLQALDDRDAQPFVSTRQNA
ncbi:hypothetical protein [Pseudomonas putida]|uniref:hypothetical protein n=1 Tax=Pseudomonas putida TaxID=303 RepID=UPI003570B7E8